jgi:hypothetical protein
MKQHLVVLAMVAALVVPAGGAQAKGCIKGAVVGGVAGHVVGHHAVAGAAVGCAIGHHEAKVKAKKEKQRAEAARHRDDRNSQYKADHDHRSAAF